MVDEPQTFRVRIGDACRQFEEVSVIIDTPVAEQSLLPAITPSPGGFVVRWQPHDCGTFLVRVLLNSLLISGSPFAVEVLPTPLLTEEAGQEEDITQGDIFPTVEEQMATLVRAFGPALCTVNLVNQISQFIVDLKPVAVHYGLEAMGRLQVIVDGPCQAKLHCKDNQDNTCSVAFLPCQAGNYSVSVLYNGFHINDSPFLVDAIDEVSQSRSPVLKPVASFRRR